MSKQDWLADVVKVLRATPPAFPGDPDPAFAVLEKAINYAYSTCFNGGEVGKDGCPVCRAYRTEVAEASAAVAVALAEDARDSAAKANEAHDLAEAEKEALAEALEEAVDARKEAEKGLDAAAKAAWEASSQEALEREERGSAQRNFAQAQKLLEAEKDKVVDLQAELDRVMGHILAVVR